MIVLTICSSAAVRARSGNGSLGNDNSVASSTALPESMAAPRREGGQADNGNPSTASSISQSIPQQTEPNYNGLSGLAQPSAVDVDSSFLGSLGESFMSNNFAPRQHTGISATDASLPFPTHLRTTSSASPISPLEQSHGTLVISSTGRSKYLGPTAASEWLKDVSIVLWRLANPSKRSTICTKRLQYLARLRRMQDLSL